MLAYIQEQVHATEVVVAVVLRVDVVCLFSRRHHQRAFSGMRARANVTALTRPSGQDSKTIYYSEYELVEDEPL